MQDLTPNTDSIEYAQGKAEQDLDKNPYEPGTQAHTDFVAGVFDES